MNPSFFAYNRVPYDKNYNAILPCRDAWLYGITADPNLATLRFDISDPESYPVKISDEEKLEAQRLATLLRLPEVVYTANGNAYYTLTEKLAIRQRLVTMVRRAAISNPEAALTTAVTGRSKFTLALMKKIAIDVVEKGQPVKQVAKTYGADKTDIRIWANIFRVYGNAGFETDPGYTTEERRKIIEEQEREGLSVCQICTKYRIFRRDHLRHYSK